MVEWIGEAWAAHTTDNFVVNKGIANMLMGDYLEDVYEWELKVLLLE